MKRKTKLLINMGMGVFKQLVTVVCGFILPRYMLLHYGSAVNGLLASVTNFLGFISLLDMGVGAVIQANLYKPLANKDTEQISKIVRSSERFFKRLAFIFLGYIAILCFAIPSTVSESFDTWYTISLLLIVSISTFVQYMFGITYQLVLGADQKSYVSLGLQVGTIIANTVLSILLMKMGASIHIVKLMTASVYVMRPIGQAIYVRKRYTIDKKVVLDGEPIQQKWNGFSQHIAAVVSENIDTVVLTLFSTLENVSIYSVYFAVTNGVQQIIMTAATGLESFFGNIIANDENETLKKTFSVIEWGVHTCVTIIFTIALITIVPFVKVYTRGIHDANYVNYAFGITLVIAYAMQCLRVPYFRIIKAAGHFKQTQNGAYIAMSLNVSITILLVFKYGLIGVALGTLVAMAYHTCYFVWYLRKHIINRPVSIFLKYLLIDGIIAGIGCYLGSLLFMTDISYVSWAIFAIKAAFFVVCTSVVVNLLLCREQFMSIRSLFTKTNG